MKKILVLSALVLLTAQSSFAASATAKAKQVVISALDIKKISDLEFGEAPQGDAAKTVAHDTVENAENASFSITGQPNKSVNVTLPTDGTVLMTTGTGGAGNEIGVNTFTSNFQTGALNAAGASTLYVGATRNALLSTQTPGSYEGEFTVNVIY